MNPDLGKITDAIKAAITTAGVYKLFIGVAFAGYWFIATHGLVPDPESWEIRTAAAGALLFGLLWMANILSSLLSFFRPRDHLAYWITNYKHALHVRRYIPSMTAKEREIIGYLLAKNQKLFVAAHDGGHAMPLISQKIVIQALQPGQGFDLENVPMVIPDYVWKILEKHKDQFPYTLDDDDFEEQPWRVDIYAI